MGQVFGGFVQDFPGGLMQKSREVDEILMKEGEDLSPLELLLRRPEPGQCVLFLCGSRLPL